jgi:hypothetical protein
MRDYKAAGSGYHTRTGSGSHKVPIWLRWSALVVAAVLAAALLAWQFIESRRDSVEDTRRPVADASAIPLALPPAGAAAVSSDASAGDPGAPTPR